MPASAASGGTRDDSLWLGTAKGLFKWTNESAALVLPFPEPVHAVFEDSNGTLWLSHGSTTQTLKDGELVTIDELNGRTKWIFEDASGVWIGTQVGLFLASDSIRQIHDPSLKDLSPVFTSHCSADGTLWMGTESGLVRHRDGQFDVFTSMDGLLADLILQLQVDNHGNLWIGGRHGYFTVPVDQFDAFKSGGIERLVCQAIEEDYGTGNLFGFGGFPSTARTPDGTTWIAAGSGVFKIPSQPSPKPSPVDVYVDHVRIDGQTFDADPAEFSSGEKRIQFDVAAPLLSGLPKAQYRLDGYHSNWLDLDKTRSVSYTDLRPGDYTFRVQSAGHQDSFDFEVRARWFELTWLRVTAFLSILVASFVFLNRRIQQMRRLNNALRREIEERHRAEEESRQNFDQMARVSRASSMGELITSIAHQVKQPLFAIISNAQTARRILDRDQPDITEIRDALEDIDNDGNRASSIIDRIRALVQKEHQPVHRLDLNEVAADAIKLSETEMRERGVQLETHFEEDLPFIDGDSIELQQVILNLLINGAQAMSGVDSQTRKLSLSTSAHDGWVELRVHDSGVGLGDASTEKIFEPFFSTKPNGTGMGLAINRTIIESHQGKIWAVQNPDAGATFCFRLPVSDLPQAT